MTHELITCLYSTGAGMTYIYGKMALDAHGKHPINIPIAIAAGLIWPIITLVSLIAVVSYHCKKKGPKP